MKIRRILAPIDYSPGSLAALEQASWLGIRLGADVDVMHVVDQPGSAPAQDLESFVSLIERKEPIRLNVRIERGDPASVIVRVADTEGYDLVVMGTHGRTGVRRTVLGSVAEKVVRLSPIPVLTVRLAPARAHAHDERRRRVASRAGRTRG